MGAQGTTKGHVLSKRLDAQGDHMREMRANGILPRITARRLEEMAEEEYERRTWNGWGRTLCGLCHTAMSDNGACVCHPDGTDTEQNRLLKMLGLPPVTASAMAPGEALTPRRVVTGPYTCQTEHGNVVAMVEGYAHERGITPSEAARAMGRSHLWLGTMGR